jgi:transposase InsO family protein
VIFAAIANWAPRKEYPVAFMCKQLSVTEQGYYQFLKRGVTNKVCRDGELEDMIRDYHRDLKGNPGVRRIHNELKAHGVRTSHKRVARIMAEAGLVGRHIRAYKATTVSDGRFSNIPDLVRRVFCSDEQDRVWVGDISYIRTSSGFKYLATVIDLFSRRVVGYSLASHMRTELIADALKMAVRMRKPARGVVFHHDCGSQYTSREYRDLCTTLGVVQSCGAVGSCFDNAVAESFFATIKKELIRTRPWLGLTDLTREVVAWIEDYYNVKRRHSYLDYLTPAEYELGYRSVYELAA